MGYDMTIEQPDGLTEDDAYFRLNIFGMSNYRDAMVKLDMAAYYYEMPEWPKLPEGITWDDMEVILYPEYHKGETPKPEAVAHEAVRAEHQAWRPDKLGIAVHKLCSNDSWLVTPGEIGEALAAYEKRGEEQIDITLRGSGLADRRDYWDKWIAYLRRAQAHGGFRVH